MGAMRPFSFSRMVWAVRISLFVKFQFIAQCAVTMRARCGWFRYFPDPLGNVAAARKFQFIALLIHRRRPSITTVIARRAMPDVAISSTNGANM